MSLGPFDQSASDRWQVVTQPAALPACCFLCQGDTSTREWFVDLALQFEFHGAVYICNECFGTIARTVGWLDPAVAEKIAEQTRKLMRENFELQREVAALHSLEEAVDSFVLARDSRRDAMRGDSSLASFDLSEPDGDFDGVDEGGEGPSSDREEPVDAGTREAPESGDGEGVDELRPDAGADAVFTITL